MDQYFLETPLGVAHIQGDENGITSLKFNDKNINSSKEIPNSLIECVTQLKEYLKGERKIFDFKISPSGTDFQKKVWQELRNIPYGETITYSQLSIRLGHPKAIRAVAAANGKNPIMLVIPCHRVIGKDGSLVGYAGGLARKRWLLEYENPTPQQSLFS